jgi:hypothetical protein
MEEEWKTITDYPDYEISNLGNCRNISTIIRSNKQKPFKNLKFSMSTTTGYRKYDLNRYDENGIKTRKTLSIHRLVAIHFIPNPDNKQEVDHIDNNHLNNSILNLRWVHPYENMRNKNKWKKNSTSNFIGISYDKSRDKWKYQIKLENTKIMKRFETEMEAVIKRDEYILDNNLPYFKLNLQHI